MELSLSNISHCFISHNHLIEILDHAYVLASKTELYGTSENFTLFQIPNPRTKSKVARYPVKQVYMSGLLLLLVEPSVTSEISLTESLV